MNNKSWIDKTLTSESSEESSVLNKPRFNLTKQHIDFIKRRVDELNQIKKSTHDPNIVLSSIKSSLNNEKGDLYENIAEHITEFFPDFAKSFAGQILSYKKKACRNGLKCRDIKNCIFLHEENNKRQIDFDDDYSKKPKNDENNTEIVLNRVPDHIKSIDIQKYSESYGKVRFVRKIGESRYLVRFFSSESAFDMIKSSNDVCNVSSITKSYQKINKSQHNNDLFINKKFSDCRLILDSIKTNENYSQIKRIISLINDIEKSVSEGNTVKNRFMSKNDFIEE